MKNLMLKVFIEILNAIQLVLKSLFKAYHISKISVLGATLYMFLNIMYLIVCADITIPAILYTEARICHL